MNVNIFMAGVGGQGIILAGDVVAEAAMLHGHSVRKSEVHGMAQRGGSVTCQIRYGESVYSPLIRRGEADILFALERLEAVRYVNELRPGGTVLMNDQRINPSMLIWGKVAYPEDIPAVLQQQGVRVLVIPAHRIARELGNLRIVNVVMLGALSTVIDLDEDMLLSGIEKRIPPRHLELNLRGFAQGRQAGLDAARNAPPAAAAS